MDPNITEPDMTIILSWITWFIRNLAIAWTLAAPAVTCMGAMVDLLARRQVELDAYIVESGMIAWVIGAVCCLIPFDQGSPFVRCPSVALVAGALLWGVVIVIFGRDR